MLEDTNNMTENEEVVVNNEVVENNDQEEVVVNNQQGSLQVESKMPEITPVIFDKQQFEAYSNLFADAPEGPTALIAKTLANEVKVDMPDMFNYNSLRDGTAKIFDLKDDLKNLSPAERSLSDEDIISLFAVDTEGLPIDTTRSPAFVEGVKRDFIPAALASLGGFKGAEIAKNLVMKGAQRHPLGILATTIFGGLGGSMFGYGTGQLISEELLGPEKPLLPSQQAAYESGRTAVNVAAWLPMPFYIKPNVNLGVADYLTNLAITDVKNAPRSVRFTAGVERMMGSSATAARETPKSHLAREILIGGGMTGGAYAAESLDPGDTLTRILFETGGGITAAFGSPVATAVGNIGNIKNLWRTINEQRKEGGWSKVFHPIKNKRQEKAVVEILNVLEGQEVRNAEKMNIRQIAIDNARTQDNITDPAELERIGDEAVETFVKGKIDDVIERLSSDEISSQLKDPDGNLIPLTAGSKSGNAALLAIETSLSKMGSRLGDDRRKGSQNAITALKNLILGMSLSEDQRVLQKVADMSEEAFRLELDDRIKDVTAQVLKAYEKIAPDVTSNERLSEDLYKALGTVIAEARAKEKKLWNAIPNVEIKTFYDKNGVEIDTPNFVTYWKERLSGEPPETKGPIVGSMNAINNFVKRKTKELGLDPDNLPDKIVPLTLNDLKSLRSEALSKGRTFTEKGDSNKANIAFGMADAFLADIEGMANKAAASEGSSISGAYKDVLADLNPNFEHGFALAYNTARAYSRGFNDTFKRSFLGDFLNREKTGLNNSPELLAKTIVQGGSDPTNLRVRQINDIGNFIEKQGLEGVDSAKGTLLDVTETILRNAKLSAFDPNTKTIDPIKLQKYIKDNEDVLNKFPSLKNDLGDLEKASVLFQEETALRASREKEMLAQKSFYDLMNPPKDPLIVGGKRVRGVENPTTAISAAVNSKTPIKDLNDLLNVINRADVDETMKKSARDGFKSAVLEWATTSAGLSHSGTFSPSTLWKRMFEPLKHSQNKVSLLELDSEARVVGGWLLEKKIMNQAEANNLKKFLSEMVKFEAAEHTGELDGLIADKAGPIIDFYLGITGSALGTTLQKKLSGGNAGPGAIIAAARGAEIMREVFTKMPAALQADVMSEMMRNPELLAKMMRKPRTAKEKKRLFMGLKEMFQDLGFTPARREVPNVPRELVDDEYEIEIPEEVDTNVAPAQVIPDQSSLPTPPTVPTQASVGAAPSMNLVGSAAPATPTTNSGPVDRTRYAAIFPGDTASQMIRSGIGSLGAV